MQRYLLTVSFCALFLVCPFTKNAAYSCENSYEKKDNYTPAAGAEDIASAKSYIDKLTTGFEPMTLEQLQEKKVAAEKGDFHNQSDYAVALMKFGKHKEAREILEKLAVEQPEESEIAANLGLACELLGDNKNGLEWITKSIKLNVNSQSGTEWLHVEILKAKINLEDNPNWLKEHSVLALNFESVSFPSNFTSNEVTDFLGEKQSLANVQRALELQLQEQLSYTKRADAVAANLLFTLGNIQMMNHQYEKASHVYKYVMNDSVLQDRELLAAKIEEARSHSESSVPQVSHAGFSVDPMKLTGLGAVVMLVGFLIVSKMWNYLATANKASTT